jgi:hypothetical protein
MAVVGLAAQKQSFHRQGFAMLEGLVGSAVRKLLVATICCGLTTCATTGHYEATLNSWKGSSEASLIESWGTPTDIFNSNGHKFLVYQVSKTASLEPLKNHSSGSRAYSEELSCTTVFGIVDGHVVEWATKGNNCRR